MEFDFRHRERFFIDTKGNKREKVVELKITKYNKDINTIEIEFQNDMIINRGNFFDKEIGVASIKNFGIAYQDCVILEEKGTIKFITQKKKIKESSKPKVKILFLVGYYNNNIDDELENFLEVNDKELKEIEEKVAQINEKYGIYFRVPKGEIYYYLNDIGEIVKTTDKYSEEDNKRNEIGNYFTNERRIELFKEKLKKYIEENIQGNFNIFYYDECFVNSNCD